MEYTNPKCTLIKICYNKMNSVAPITAHVAFEKAAFYYGMFIKYIDINMETGVVEPHDIEAAINSNTVCVWKFFILLANYYSKGCWFFP